MIIWMILTIFAFGSALIISRLMERKWPIDPNLPLSAVIGEWKVTSANTILTLLLSPLMLPCSAALVSLAGGGLIRLPTRGWWYVVSLVVFVAFADLVKYGQHRLQHAVPFLWAMHSFHHSAPALTLMTGARHLWLEKMIFGAFFPIIPILVAIPADMAMIVSVILFVPDGCAHLNVRFPMGRAITWINSPQWHRIHHSVLPEHHDKNFAALLPIWDILFGTAWIPQPNEYPPPGLLPSETVDLLDSIVWPFRRRLGRALRARWEASLVPRVDTFRNDDKGLL